MKTVARSGVLACVVLGCGLFGLTPVQAQDDDANVEITRNNPRVWLLEFKEGKVGRVQIKDDTGDVENFWFLPYTLTNKDAVAHSYFLDIVATSDRGKHSFRYHDIWIPDVYEEIRNLLGVREGEQLLSQKNVSMPPPDGENVLPRVDDKETKQTAKIALPVLQPGETVRCVAIFRPFHDEMDELVISVHGLSNSSIISKQDYEAPDGQPHRRVIREAVLDLHYSRRGDEFAHGQDSLLFVRRRWRDRERVIKSDLR